MGSTVAGAVAVAPTRDRRVLLGYSTGTVAKLNTNGVARPGGLRDREARPSDPSVLGAGSGIVTARSR